MIATRSRTWSPWRGAGSWAPARIIAKACACARCGREIPRDKPGSTTGTRGTKAWFCRELNEWECLRCHDEGTRAELARLHA